MSELETFLNQRIIDCEETFANAGTNPDMIFLDGMLKHGGETNALLMVIGRRQAYTEILEQLRKRRSMNGGNGFGNRNVSKRF